jgi:hypothetical protein
MKYEMQDGYGRLEADGSWLEKTGERPRFD